MPIAKYDFEELKKEYISGTYIEVQYFLTTFLRLDPKTASNGYWKGKTKGWRIEKEQMKKLQTTNAVEKMAENPEVSKFTQLLIQAKQNAIAKVAKLIGGNTEITSKDIPNIQKGIEICNLELGLATTIGKLELTGKDGNPIQTETSFTLNFINTNDIS